jgi:hypothetical protein
MTAPGGIQAHISSIVASKSARGLNKFYICIQGGTGSILLIYLSLSVPESGAMPRTLANFHASICPLADALPPSRSSICSDNQENLYSTLAQASATSYRKKQVARCLGYRGKCEILRCTGEPPLYKGPVYYCGSDLQCASISAAAQGPYRTCSHRWALNVTLSLQSIWFHWNTKYPDSCARSSCHVPAPSSMMVALASLSLPTSPPESSPSDGYAATI